MTAVAPLPGAAAGPHPHWWSCAACPGRYGAFWPGQTPARHSRQTSKPTLQGENPGLQADAQLHIHKALPATAAGEAS